jgi:2-polyprenyl-3-methyl-5-hydroxy-6-metoxy-1,4-benzoquinol methylase
MKGYFMPESDYYLNERKYFQQILPVNPGRVLDIGCAAGMLGAALKKKGATEVVGVEIVPEIAKKAEQRLDKVFSGDIETLELPFADGFFDTIICADVLEHLRDPWQTVRKLASLLKSATGVFAACIPNISYYEVLLSLFGGSFDYQDMGILDRTHLRFFTFSTAREMIENAGLKVETIRTVILDRDKELHSAINSEFLKRDILKFFDRFKVHIPSEQKALLDIDQLFVWQYIFIAKRLL